MKLLLSQTVLLWCVLLCGLASSSTRAASVVLREHAEDFGSVIRLGDIADVSSATTAEVDDLATTPLLAAPAAGTNLFLRLSQIRDLLTSRGVNLNNVSFSGAAVVEIGGAAKLVVATKKPLVEELPLDEVESIVLHAIEQYLDQQAARTGWRIEFELDATILPKIARLGRQFQVRGGRRPWSGTQRFRLSTADSASPIFVTARVVEIGPAVFVLRKIERGDLIRAADVEVRQHEGRLPATTLTSLRQVIGKESLRSIPLGAIVQKNFVREPLMVERGETVTVFARTGGVSVRTFATAKQDGAQGELIQVETLDKKERFNARISGRRELEVLATGARARDFASFDNRDRR